MLSNRIPGPGGLGSLTAVVLAACIVAMNPTARADNLVKGLDAYSKKRFAEAYAEFRPLAEPGLPEVQNLVGFLVFLGRGVHSDPASAHGWFHKASAGGSIEAKLNLAALHMVEDSGVGIDIEEARKYLQQLPPPPQVVYGVVVPERDRNLARILSVVRPVLFTDDEFDFAGKRIFNTYCAGCHGIDGMAVFPGAPSFTMGERLNKSDEELLKSVMKGKNMMPGWENLLPRSHLEFALLYLRSSAIVSRYNLLVDSMDRSNSLRFIFYYPGSF